MNQSMSRPISQVPRLNEPVPDFEVRTTSILRAMVYYPVTNGRSIPELIRLLQALQTFDAHGVATQVDWHPGEKVIVPPPATAADVRAGSDDEGYECIDRYFCKKELPRSKPPAGQLQDA